MKKFIILTVATLSTGIVLSNSLKKSDTSAKPASLEVQKNVQSKIAAPSYSVVAQGD